MGGPVFTHRDQQIILLVAGAIALVVMVVVALVVGSVARSLWRRRGRDVDGVYAIGFGLAMVVQVVALGAWYIQVTRHTYEPYPPEPPALTPVAGGTVVPVDGFAITVQPDDRHLTVWMDGPTAVHADDDCRTQLSVRETGSSETELAIAGEVAVSADSDGCSFSSSASYEVELPEPLGSRDLVVEGTTPQRWYRLEPSGFCPADRCVAPAPPTTAG